jgi:hypothetical protein
VIDNPQGETGLSLLRKIDSMVDSIVVVCKKNTTTTLPTKYTTTMRKKLIKFFLNNPPRKILQTIIQLEAFTAFTLQSLLDLTSTQTYPALRFLQEFEVIKKHTKIRGKAAPPTIVFLLDGGNEDRVHDAVQTHFDLMPRGVVKTLEYYVDRRLVESIIAQVEMSRFDKSVRKAEILKFAKELDGPLDYTVVLATIKHFRERGWEVIL